MIRFRGNQFILVYFIEEITTPEEKTYYHRHPNNSHIHLALKTDIQTKIITRQRGHPDTLHLFWILSFQLSVEHQYS